MRISSSRAHKEGYTRNDDPSTLKASGETPESRQDNISETLDTAKDALDDDAYTLLLPNTESEEKVKIATNFPFARYYYILIIFSE